MVSLNHFGTKQFMFHVNDDEVVDNSTLLAGAQAETARLSLFVDICSGIWVYARTDMMLKF